MSEPRNHKLFLLLLTLCILGSVPLAFVGRSVRFALGLPVWLWSSLAFTVGLSLVTAWGFARLWRDEADGQGDGDE